LKTLNYKQKTPRMWGYIALLFIENII